MAGLKSDNFGHEVALTMDAIMGSLPGSMVKQASLNEDDDIAMQIATAETKEVTALISKVASIADSLGSLGYNQSEFIADALIGTIKKEAVKAKHSDVLMKELSKAQKAAEKKGLSDKDKAKNKKLQGFLKDKINAAKAKEKEEDKKKKTSKK